MGEYGVVREVKNGLGNQGLMFTLFYWFMDILVVILFCSFIKML